MKWFKVPLLTLLVKQASCYRLDEVVQVALKDISVVSHSKMLYQRNSPASVPRGRSWHDASIRAVQKYMSPGKA